MFFLIIYFYIYTPDVINMHICLCWLQQHGVKANKETVRDTGPVVVVYVMYVYILISKPGHGL